MHGVGKTSKQMSYSFKKGQGWIQVKSQSVRVKNRRIEAERGWVGTSAGDSDKAGLGLVSLLLPDCVTLS